MRKKSQTLMGKREKNTQIPKQDAFMKQSQAPLDWWVVVVYFYFYLAGVFCNMAPMQK